MIQAKQQNPFNSEGLIRESAGSPPLSIRHVGFARPLAFAAEKGEPIVVEAGLYRVEASDDGRIVLVSDTGEATPVPTVRDWHDQVFDDPVALDLEREDEHALVLLLPGGVALHSSGSYGQVRSGYTAGTVHNLTTFYEGIFKIHKLKFGSFFNPNLWTLNWGKVLPTTPAAPFVPASFPPNWVSTKVVTCEVPPAGSYGPGGPGTASGLPPFQPGDVVLRGPFKVHHRCDSDVFRRSPVGGQGSRTAGHGPCGIDRLPDDPLDDVAGHLPDRPRRQWSCHIRGRRAGDRPDFRRAARWNHLASDLSGTALLTERPRSADGL